MAGANSNPTNAGAIPDDIRAIIDQYVRDEVARLTAGQNPEPVKELTPAEKVGVLLDAAVAAERADHAIPSSSGRTHEIILSILGILADAVFPAPVASEAA